MILWQLKAMAVTLEIDSSDLISAAEAARILKYDSSRTIHYIRERGELTCVRLSARKILYLRSEIQKRLQNAVEQPSLFCS